MKQSCATTITTTTNDNNDDDDENERGREQLTPKTQVMHKAISHHPLTDAQPSPKQSVPPNQLPPAQQKIQHGLSIVCQCREETEGSCIFSILFCKTSFS